MTERSIGAAEKLALEERLRHKDEALEQEKLKNSELIQEITQLRSQLEQEQQGALQQKRKMNKFLP